MEIDEHISALRREGLALAAAAEKAGPDAPVPTCPEWATRDLVLHVGEVHRWAAAHVRDRRAEPADPSKEPDLVGPLPSDAALLDWYREGHESLLGVLEGADAGVECWTFLPARSPLAFWARRQCHETTIHRADAESAVGEISAIEPRVAEDGIDEMLGGFLGRPRRRDVVEAVTLQLVAADVGRWSVVVIAPDGVQVAPETTPAGPVCTVTGPASDLDLLLWNRRSADGLDVEGDPIVLATWSKAVQIKW
jgi:uncharacterized protein (TIGR03083 family)